jgi:transcriptional regulator with XRE-family HTH domain
MYKNKNGLRNNITGTAIKKYRRETLKISQRQLADLMQSENIDLNKNAIQRIESGERFITDIELLAFSKVLDVSIDELYRI